MTIAPDNNDELNAIVFDRLLNAASVPLLQGFDDGKELGPFALTIVNAVARGCLDLLSDPDLGRPYLSMGAPTQLLLRLGIGPAHDKDSPLIKRIRQEVESVYQTVQDPRLEGGERADRLLQSFRPPPAPSHQYRAIIRGDLGNALVDFEIKREGQGKWAAAFSLPDSGATVFVMLYECRQVNSTLSYRDLVKAVKGNEELQALRARTEIASVANQVINDHLFKRCRQESVSNRTVVRCIRKKGYELHPDFKVIDNRRRSVSTDNRESVVSRSSAEVIGGLTPFDRQVIEFLRNDGTAEEAQEKFSLTSDEYQACLARIQAVADKT